MYPTYSENKNARARRYEPILLNYVVDSEQNVVRRFKDLIGWVLEDKISVVRARALVFALRGFAEIGLEIERNEQRIVALEHKHFEDGLSKISDAELASAR